MLSDKDWYADGKAGTLVSANIIGSRRQGGIEVISMPIPYFMNILIFLVTIFIHSLIKRGTMRYLCAFLRVMKRNKWMVEWEWVWEVGAERDLPNRISPSHPTSHWWWNNHETTAFLFLRSYVWFSWIRCEKFRYSVECPLILKSKEKHLTFSHLIPAKSNITHSTIPLYFVPCTGA